MRILILGAGALGGYFGARLLEAGRDVSFLVRPARAEVLARTGLVVRSPFGNLKLADAPRVSAEQLGGPYDLVLLGCKSYDLDSAMDAVAAAVGPQTAIVPLLNGLRHLDALAARFGNAAVLGGRCMISASLAADGTIDHHNDQHVLTFGERDGQHSARVEAIAAEFAGARCDAVASEHILQDMWEKWVFIAAAAGLTTLMRASVGDIVEAGQAWLGSDLLDECAAIAARAGFAPGEQALANGRAVLSVPGSPLTASMLKDIERGSRTEAAHIIGDLIGRAGDSPATLLRVAHAHLLSYEARRRRVAHA